MNPSFFTKLASVASDAVPVLGDAAVKAAFLLFAAGVIAMCLQRRSAAVRHLVWSAGLCGALLMPLFSMLLPAWRVRWMPEWTNIVSTRSSSPHDQLAERPQLIAERPTATYPSAVPPPPSHTATPVETAANLRRDDVSRIAPAIQATAKVAVNRAIAMVWLAGSLLALVPFLIGLRRVFWLTRQARMIVDGDSTNLLRQACNELDVRHPVRMFESADTQMPFTWGAWRPVLVMPSIMETWTPDRRRMVILHELAHIKRWDWLTQVLAYSACAMYWFNPFVWLAARRVRVEREQACDDLVLATGSKPSAYAGELLTIATGLRGDAYLSLAAMPMARSSSLEGRLLAILDGKRNRAALTRKVALFVLALLAMIAVPVAMLRSSDVESDPPPGYEQGVVKSRPDLSVNVGQLKTQLGFIARREADGATRVENGLGAPLQVPLTWPQQAPAAGSELQVSLGGGGYDIVEIRVFDHATRKLLHDSAWEKAPVKNSEFTAKQWGRRSSLLLTTKKDWPKQLDLWLRIVEHAEGLNVKDRWVMRAASPLTRDGSTITMAEAHPGTRNYKLHHPTGRIEWLPGVPDDAESKCTVVFKNSGNPLRRRLYVVAVDKNGNQHVPDDPHFIDFEQQGATHIQYFDLPFEAIEHFEWRPFGERHKFYFAGVRVPRAADAPADSPTDVDSLKNLDVTLHETSLPLFDRNKQSFKTLDFNAFTHSLEITYLGSAQYGLDVSATPDEVAVKANKGDVYHLAPNVLATLRDARIVPLQLARIKPESPNWSWIDRLQHMTRSDIVAQVESFQKQDTAKEMRRAIVNKGDMFVVLRPDHDAFVLKVGELSQDPDGSNQELIVQAVPIGKVEVAAVPPAKTTATSAVELGPAEDDLSQLNLKQVRERIAQARRAKDDAALARVLEHSAELMKVVMKARPESFLRPVVEVENEQEQTGPAGPVAEAQTELDGEWVRVKGLAEPWYDRFRRIQDDMQVLRLNALVEAGDIYRKELSNPSAAIRAYKAALKGCFLEEQSLAKSIAEVWPIESDKPKERLGKLAWNYLEVLDRLAAVENQAGQLDASIDTQFKALLADLCLEWNYRTSGAPSGRARELWALIKQSGKLPSIWFWFHVLDEQHPQIEFDIAALSAKQGVGRNYLPEIVAVPGKEFATLKISATLSDAAGGLACFTVPRGGKYTTLGDIGLRRIIGENKVTTVTEMITIPADVEVVCFETVGGNVKVSQLKIEATFRANSNEVLDAGAPASDDTSPPGPEGSAPAGSKPVRPKETTPPAEHTAVSNVRSFLSALAAGEYDRAQSLTVPGKLKPEGLTRLNEQLRLNQAHISKALVGKEKAAVLTDVIEPKESKQAKSGQWGFSLGKVGDRWLIGDIDFFPNERAIEKWLAAYRKVEPAAIEIALPHKTTDLRGKWTVVRDHYVAKNEDGNTKWQEAALGKMEWIVSANRVTIRHQRAETTLPYRVDMTVTPSAIDVTRNGKSQRGIFKFHADELTICLNEPGADRRPIDFEPQAGQPKCRLYQLRRAGMEKVSEESGAIHRQGRVIDSKGRPIEGAKVELESWDGIIRGIADIRPAGTVLTDKDGRFSFPEPPTLPGSLTATVTATGFEPQSITIPQKGPVEVRLRRTATLTGRVTGPDGQPLAGAPLMLSVSKPNVSIGNFARAITDAHGNFEIIDVPPGRHELHYPWEGATEDDNKEGRWRAFIKPDESSVPLPVKHVLAATIFEFAEDEQPDPIQLDLSKSTCAVQGRLLDDNGQAMPGVKVALAWRYQNVNGSPIYGDGYPPALTDEAGRFHLTNLPPGTWSLFAWDDKGNARSTLVDVALAPGQTVQQDLRSSVPVGKNTQDGSKPLSFLADVPEFKDLHLGIAEAELKEIAKKNGLQMEMDAAADGTKHYHVSRVDGENVVVMYREGKCAGIQRMRRDEERTAALAMYSMSNMRQILVAMHVFADEHQAALPDNLDQLKPYLPGENVLANPRGGAATPDYIYLKPAVKLSEIKKSSQKIILYENPDDLAAEVKEIHVGYADGHVVTISRKQLDEQLGEQTKPAAGADIEPATATPATGKSELPTLKIVLRKEPSGKVLVFLGDREVSIEGIRDALKLQAGIDENSRVHIISEGEVPYRDVVNVLDQLRSIGIRNPSLETRLEIGAKIEFRRAEEKPADGLIEAAVQGTDQKVYLHKEAEVTNEDVADVSAAIDNNGRPCVTVTFTKEGAAKFKKLTAGHLRKPLAILIDGKVISAPHVQTVISSGAQIVGAFTEEEVQRLVKQLKHSLELQNKDKRAKEQDQTSVNDGALKLVVHRNDALGLSLDLPENWRILKKQDEPANAWVFVEVGPEGEALPGIQRKLAIKATNSETMARPATPSEEFLTFLASQTTKAGLNLKLPGDLETTVNKTITIDVRFLGRVTGYRFQEAEILYFQLGTDKKFIDANFIYPFDERAKYQPLADAIFQSIKIAANSGDTLSAPTTSGQSSALVEQKNASNPNATKDSPQALGKPLGDAQGTVIAEVLGKPIYEHELQPKASVGGELRRLIIRPLMEQYRQEHKAELEVTEEELKAMSNWVGKQAKKLAAERHAELRKIDEELTRDDVAEAKREKLKKDQTAVRASLDKPPQMNREAAVFMIDHWKLQRSFYEHYGKGRIIYQQTGLEALDAMRKWLESAEQKGDVKITHPNLRKFMYEYWELQHLFVKGNDAIRTEFLEPEWLPKAGIKLEAQPASDLDTEKASAASVTTDAKDQKHDEAEKKATDAAEAWLAKIDREQYADGWESAATFLKEAINKDDFMKSLTAARKPLGTLKTRKIKSKEYKTSLPGAPDGQYFIIQFESSFANKQSAIETITPMLKKDGIWRVSGYYIK